MASKEQQAAEAYFQAMNLNDAGLALVHSGDFTQGAEKFQEGLALLHGRVPSKPIKSAEAALSGNLAQTVFNRGQTEQAIELLERQALLAEEIDDLQSFSNALNGLALCHIEKGDDLKAESLFEQRLKVARQIGDKKGEGNSLNNLATIYVAREQYGPAIALLRQRITLARDIDDRRGEASGLINLGGIYEATSQREQAKATLRAALDLMQAEGDPRVSDVEAMLSRL